MKLRKKKDTTPEKKNLSKGKRERKRERGREQEFNIEKQKPFLHTQK